MSWRKEKNHLDLRTISPVVTRSRTGSTDDVIFSRIYDALEKADSPLESPTICRTIGGICSIWNVRDNLQKLKDERIALKVGEDGWMLTEKYEGTTDQGYKSANSRSRFDGNIVKGEYL